MVEARREGRQEERQEGLREGLQEGRQEERREIARNLKELGLPVEQIAQGTGLSVEDIAKL